MRNYISMAFEGIWSHKLRSFLTMLGIIIGIASIIAISSTIVGTNEQIKQNLIGSGNNAVVVKLYQGDMEYYMEQGIPEGIPLFDEDMRQQLLDVPEIEAASFYNQRDAYGSIYYGNTSLDGGTLLGVDANYFDVYDYIIESGRNFREEDFSQYRKVAIIDKTVEMGLFQGEKAVGKTLEVLGEPYTIIGVTDKSSDFQPVINSLEDYYMYADLSGGKVFVPNSTWPVLYSYDEPYNLVVQATGTDTMTVAGKKATDLLNAAVGENVQEISYKSEDLLEQAKELQDMSNATNQQLIWIAGIALLVGGIGVMNIMLVSVTERTREIGLKKALGARKRAISIQFLTEAGVLTFLGGIIGVLVGIGLALGIGQLTDVPVMISVPAAAAAVIFSIVIGLIFGSVPAVKAANMNPIEALRRE